MQITKYNQSCLLVETNDKRILIDPSNIDYTDVMYNKEWVNIDAILITHKHQDHCYGEIIKKIIERDNCRVYTSTEVDKYNHFDNTIIVKENDIIEIFPNIKIEVTHAEHGYLTGMRESNNEIIENIGFIIDDGKIRLYTTSDTINFYNDYKCDILCMPFNGNGLTFGIIDGINFAKQINPKLLLPIHMQHPKGIMNPNIDKLKQELEHNCINYKIMKIGEKINFNDEKIIEA
ncbi:MBL fold metallo-hydrolase [bacterium]|nr:MBL fold metallo-hydrolase [bacterium]